VSDEAGSDGADTAVGDVRWEITGGGEVGPEELAALAVALAPLVVATEPGAANGVGGGAQDTHWAKAARAEGLGHRPFVAWPDLEAGRFPLSR
jgi:hypothetical protein